MTDRCEPPAEWRDRDGWHWVQQADFSPSLARWHASERADVEPLWTSTEHVYSATPTYAVTEWGWRYLAPVTSHAEVEALRAERDALVADARAALKAHAERAAENTALRARVAELDALLREAVRMARGPSYLMAEDTLVSTLRLGTSWGERATAALERKP